MKHSKTCITIAGLALLLQTQVLHAQAAVGTAHDMSAWTLLRSGGWVMAPLAAVSVAVFSLVIYCFMTLRKNSISDSDLDSRIASFIESEDLKGLANFVANRQQALAQIIDQTLKFMHRHPDADTAAIKAIAETSGVTISATITQRIQYLLDIGVMAPMLGLFGTVVGILNSFGSIALESSPMRTMLLAGGVSQALVATAAGLIAGISAMFFYSFFRGKVQNLISELETKATVIVQEIIIMKNRHE